jgi:hypothetical protein
MASAALVTELADQVEDLMGSGGVFSIRMSEGDTGEQRARLIDTYGEVLDELRERGHHDVRGTITRIGTDEVDQDGLPIEQGEYLVIVQAKDA